jgi:hypothetical protein
VGHKLAQAADFTTGVGGMQAIVVDLDKGTMLSGAGRGKPDTRSDANPGTPHGF